MTPAQLIASVLEPDPAFTPAPIWWWSGEPLEIDRLCWQIDQLIAMGIRNVVLLNLAPSGPLFGSDSDDPHFLTDKWWDIFCAVCEHSKKVGMRIYFYDQIGFSGANFQAQLVTREPKFSALNLGNQAVERTGRLSLTCPGDGEPIAAYYTPIDGPLRPTYVPIVNRTASAEVGSTKSRLRLVYSYKMGFDYFSKEACQALLETVHEQFARRASEYFGSTIVGSFQDELPTLPFWGPTFARSFEQKFRYSIEKSIHALFDGGSGGEEKVRRDFAQLRADLAEESLFIPFFNWHEKHGLICGFDQQGPARGGEPIGCTHKYADYLRTMRWYGAPGTDHHGHVKIHSSLAFLYNRPRVWVESFHSSGWGGSIEETFDWLLPFLRTGGTLYNPHAVYYGLRQGWWEWAPPSTCWRQPYARHYKVFSNAIARICKLLSQGTHICDIGMLFPTTTTQSWVGATNSLLQDEKGVSPAKRANEIVDALQGRMTWMYQRDGELEKNRRDYHILDDDSLAAAEIRGAAIEIKGVSFKTIILPGVTHLTDDVQKMLRDFSKIGGRIVAVGCSADLLKDVKTIERMNDPAQIESALAGHERYIDAPVSTLHRRVGETDVLFVPAVATRASTIEAVHWMVTTKAFLDRSKYLKSAEIRVKDRIGSVVRFDPFTGETIEVATRVEGNDTVVSFDFDGAACAILLWKRNSTDSHHVAKAHQSKLPLDGDWLCEPLAPTAQKYFDLVDVSKPQLIQPHSWRMDWSEDGAKTFREVAVTFGRYGHHSGPAPADALHFDSPAEIPVEYSQYYGIFKDLIHRGTLGPKGHVPQEFIELGELKRGQAVLYRTRIFAELAQDAYLVIGSSQARDVRLNGQEIRFSQAGYETTSTVKLVKGDNLLEIKLTPPRDMRVRMYFCFVHPDSLARFTRPKFIVHPDAPAAETKLTFEGRFRLNEPAKHGFLQVAVLGVARVYLDDQFLGRQGGFDPYALHLRVTAYPLPDLDRGEHRVRIEMTDPGQPSPLMVDLAATLSSGQAFIWTSSTDWTVSRDNQKPAQAVAATDLSSRGDLAHMFLTRRPHPLRGAAWSEGPQPADVVLNVTPTTGRDLEQVFRWKAPPGAIAMNLPLADGTRIVGLKANAKQIDIPANSSHVKLPVSPMPMEIELIVRSAQVGGSVFNAPVGYDIGSGTLEIGKSWHEQGLAGFSGALRMRKTFDLKTHSEKSLHLDLGAVRGTVEAFCNGKPVGTRVVAPFRFDITDAMRDGANEIELIVTNTLGSHISVWSPSRAVADEQITSGVFGPVELVWSSH